MMKFRLVAGGIHFAVSILVITLFLGVVYFIWYPKPFYSIHSVHGVIKITIIVSLLIGPLLTILVFNKHKARHLLLQDMVVIAVVQISALVWAMHITYKVRPVYFVYQDGVFYSVVKEEIDTEKLRKDTTLPAIWEKPKAVYIESLSVEEAVQEAMGELNALFSSSSSDSLLSKVQSGSNTYRDDKKIMHQAERYQLLERRVESSHMQDITNNAISYDRLIEKKKESVDMFLSDKSGSIEEFLFYPVESTGIYSGVIVFNKKNFLYSGLLN